MPVTQNETLLTAIRGRKSNPNAFHYGIKTADAYVRTLQDCIGLPACYKYAAAKNVSFADSLKRASNTLVYGTEDMLLDEVGYSRPVAGSSPKMYEDIVLPKNTLMVFRHTLTSPRKDRDGDILRTQGAQLDQKMLLLWQHVHTLPIGKLLAIHEHNAKHLKVISCIVDMSPLAHDAAVMIDNDMGRFSHGFRALEFLEMKAADGMSPGGFDVKRFEIMEESLVSVPSNVDSDTDEVMLSLIEGGKMTSPLMKDVGKSIRGRRSIRVPVTVDLQLMLNGKEYGKSETKCDCGCGGEGPCKPGKAKPAPEETDVDVDEAAAKAAAGGTEVVVAPDDKASKPDAHDVEDGADECPECGDSMKNGVCKQCGYKAPVEETDKGFCPTGPGGGQDNSCGRGGGSGGGGGSQGDGIVDHPWVGDPPGWQGAVRDNPDKKVFRNSKGQPLEYGKAYEDWDSRDKGAVAVVTGFGSKDHDEDEGGGSEPIVYVKTTSDDSPNPAGEWREPKSLGPSTSLPSWAKPKGSIIGEQPEAPAGLSPIDQGYEKPPSKPPGRRDAETDNKSAVNAAMSTILALATFEQRVNLQKTLAALNAVDEQHKKVDDYLALTAR